MMDHDRQTSSGLAASVLRTAGVDLPWEADKDGLTVPADLHAAIHDESTVSRQFDVPDDWPFGGLT